MLIQLSWEPPGIVATGTSHGYYWMLAIDQVRITDFIVYAPAVAAAMFMLPGLHECELPGMTRPRATITVYLASDTLDAFDSKPGYVMAEYGGKAVSARATEACYIHPGWQPRSKIGERPNIRADSSVAWYYLSEEAYMRGITPAAEHLCGWLRKIETEGLTRRRQYVD